MYNDFKEIPFTTDTNVLAKIYIQNVARFLQKLTLGLKYRIWTASDKQRKSKKLKFDGLILSKKYIPSAKIHTLSNQARK